MKKEIKINIRNKIIEKDNIMDLSKYIENLNSGSTMKEFLEEIWHEFGFAPLFNGDFRDFRKKRSYGVDFLVLSPPHKVENFRKTSYETLCFPKQ